jgi:radical SAM protein with 4Fe4S-binding SPASM domain
MIILTGGEPMERSDIYDIIQYGKGLGLRMVMATCGYGINDESIIKLKKSGIAALSISLDGATAETHDAFRQTDGSFDVAVNAAKTVRNARVRFQINTTLCKLNIDEFHGIVELAKKLGARCFNPFILVPTGRGKQIADEILDPVEYETVLHEMLRIKLESEIEVRITCGPQFARICRQEKMRKLNKHTKGCIGGRQFGFISYRGDVQICGFYNVSAGSLIKNNFNFGKIWRESELLKKIRSLVEYKGACGTCEYIAVCGGCRARAYAMTGDHLAADPVCNYPPKGQR